MTAISKKLIFLLPSDFIGGNVLLFDAAADIDREFLFAVCKIAESLTFVSETVHAPESIETNSKCNVEYVKKDQVKNKIFSLVILCNVMVNSDLTSHCLSWLLPQGYAMFIGRCSKINTDAAIQCGNTTYTVDKTFKTTPLQDSFAFEFVSSKFVESFQNNQVLFSGIYKKSMRGPTVSLQRNYDNFQEVINEKTYSKTILGIIERVFSRHDQSGFVSTGGAEVAEEWLRRVDFQPGQRVLDVGCGTGGATLMNAKKFNVNVVGVDISTNMINAALKAAESVPELRPNLEFEVCDIERREFPEGTFDVIYTKDVIFHVMNKGALFKKFVKWLKPGGKVLIADYCRSNQEYTDMMKEYMKARHNVWFLITQSEYGKLLQEAGLVNVDVQDQTSVLQESSIKEHAHLIQTREELLKEFDVKLLDYWTDAWENKIKSSQNGDLLLGVFYAEKNTAQ